MKFIYAVFLTAAFLFASCCSNISKDKNNNNIIKKQQPAAIKSNQSKVTAEVKSIDIIAEDNFIIKARVTSVENDPANESMAIQGSTYSLKPSFVIINQKIDENSDRNNRLKSLKGLKAGDNFNAVIFYDGVNGWFIRDIID